MFKLISYFIFFITFLSYVAFSQNSSDFVKKNLNARGGIENLKKIKSIQINGKIQTSGLELSMVYYRKMPNKIRFQVDLNGKDGITVFTSDSGWIVDPSINIIIPKKLTKDEYIQKKQLIDYLLVFYDDLLMRSYETDYRIDYLGTENVNNKTGHKLLIVTKDGVKIQYFLDEKDYLDYHHKVNFPDLNVTFDINLNDFTTVEGINIPLSIESRIQDQRMTRIIIDKIKINEIIDDKLFVEP